MFKLIYGKSRLGLKFLFKIDARIQKFTNWNILSIDQIFYIFKFTFLVINVILKRADKLSSVESYLQVRHIFKLSLMQYKLNSNFDQNFQFSSSLFIKCIVFFNIRISLIYFFFFFIFIKKKNLTLKKFESS